MSKYNSPLRKESLTQNEDGTFTVKGGGWFWVKFDARGNIIAKAPGMDEKPSARLFISQAKLTFQAYSGA